MYTLDLNGRQLAPISAAWASASGPSLKLGKGAA